MSKKTKIKTKGKATTVRGNKKEITKALAKPQKFAKSKEPAMAKEKNAQTQPKRISQKNLTHKDVDAFRMRAYMGPLEVDRVVNKTLPGPKENIENTIFMERLRKEFDPKSVIATNAPNKNGLIWRMFVIGTEHVARFATDRNFGTGIGVGNPTFKGSKKNDGIALQDFLKGTGIVPQRNKPESYRFFPATEGNFKACVAYIAKLGGQKRDEQSEAHV